MGHMTTTKATSTRLSDKAKLWITKALKADYAQTNEHVIWELSVAVFPDPAATASPYVDDSTDPSALVPIPTLALYLEIPGADPKTSLYIAPIIAPYMLTEENVVFAVTSALKSMRDTRQKMLDVRSQ